MGRTITIASGKGGVGKTTITANLGIALAKRGKKVLLIDGDIAMANLSLILGMQSSPITLHDVLLGEAVVQDAIYDGPGGVSFIPSGLSLESYRRVDSERLASVVKAVAPDYDFVFLDAPAGIEKNVMAAINACEETLLVTQPNAPSLADVLKTKIVSQRLGKKPIGIIVNFVMHEKGEISDEDLMRMIELPVYGMVPFDAEVRKSFMQEKVAPLVIRTPDSPAAIAIQKTAAKLAGLPVEFIGGKREGFLSRLLSIFSRNKKQ